MMRLVPLLAAIAWCLAPADAAGQVSIGGGVTWSGGYAIGESAAELRTNAPGSTTPAFTLFETRSRFTPAFGAEARVGVDIGRRITIEGGAAYSRPRVRVTIAADSESGSQQLAGEALQQYVFDAAMAWRFAPRLASRLGPFVLAGAGYVRQLHQERTLVESGQIYYAGAGARYWLRGRPDSGKSFGLRGDLRMNFRRQGIDFENQARAYPTLSLQVFARL